MSIKNLYPSIRPSLSLDFAKTKQLDPRIDFTRASGATYYDGKTVAKAEENLLQYSREFDLWANENMSVVANDIEAPDGTMTADKLVVNTVNDKHARRRNNNFDFRGSVYSAFFKKGNARYVYLSVYQYVSSSFPRVVIADLDTQTFTDYYAPYFTPNEITDVGNGWYRVSIFVNSYGGSSLTWVGISSGPNLSDISFAGTDEFVYVWGAQLEEGAFPTSYIKTEASQVTRSADSPTDTTIEDWFNPAEGTLYVEAVGIDNVTGGATRRFAEIHDGGTLNRMIFGYASTTSTRFLTITNNATQSDVQVSGANAGSLVKMASTYKFNDMQQASNSLIGTADTIAVVPVVNTLVIGDSVSVSNTSINGHIRKLAYYPKRLTNEQLQALTS